MLELTDWLSSTKFPDRPWLVLGKGPTFDRHAAVDLRNFNVLGLNHAAAEVPVDVAHVIDIDVIEACGDRLADRCRWLVMPRYPHLGNKAVSRRLEDFHDDLPVLRRLDEEGRLVWYNLLGATPVGRSPVIGVRYFSSEAALALLGLLGARTVRSLGIDGGRSYGSAFRHLEDHTLLANGRPVFDLQFDQLDTIAAEHGIDYQPLIQPLRIFIGTDESQMVAYRVLEYSIRKAASTPVKITPMDLPAPLTGSDGRRTPFQLSPFVIPGLCGQGGRAAYLPADALVLGDVAELAAIPFGGHQVLRVRAADSPAPSEKSSKANSSDDTSLMLLDCDHPGIGESGRLAHVISAEWDHVERYDPAVTKLLRYAMATTQPWKNDLNPLGEVWTAWYREAVEAGAVPPEEVEALIAAGHVKPSLAAALRLAPSRRAVVTDASLSLVVARERIASLEAKLAQARASRFYRLEWNLRRALRGSTRLFRGRLGAVGKRRS